MCLICCLWKCVQTIHLFKTGWGVNQDSSGRVVTLSRGAWPTSQGSVSSRVRDLSVLHSIQNGIRAHSVTSPVPGDKEGRKLRWLFTSISCQSYECLDVYQNSMFRASCIIKWHFLFHRHLSMHVISFCMTWLDVTWKFMPLLDFVR